MTILTPYSGSLPSVNSPSTFNNRAGSLFSWLTGTWVPEMNALTLQDFTGGTPAQLDTLELGSNDVNTITDLRMAGNAVMSAQTSTTFAFESGGYFRFMKDVTAYTGGIAGGTEIGRLDADKFEMDVPFRGDGVLGTCAYSAANTGALLEAGNNANGYYIRRADGVQICWHVLAVPYLAAGSCSATWTLPANFTSTGTMAVTTALGSTASATPTQAMILAPRVNAYTTSSATITVARVQGQTNFDPSDTVNAHVAAFGRWRA